MSDPNKNPVDEVYRQFQQSHTMEANVIDWYYKELTTCQQMIKQLQLQVVELQKNKIPQNYTEEVPKSNEKKK